MSAWTVYWLFTLDSIKFFSRGWLIASILLFATSYVVKAWAKVDPVDPKANNFGNKLMPVSIVMFLLSSFIFTFIPTTKTMAAIIIFPKIASAENLNTVSKDTGDIYNLAMRRLKDALGEPTK